ncbi:hypothetical protein PBRA_009564 [Plasmodiophora brassicae]|uniref:DUF4371 domain-containing protein n=1 Tax=Plasmodiophora brassicae TaxID=37360 RepID=A0A0G4J933_PLABS|nr:hypothetical protein PBRA_009564 [Plasmodiophora brassicae]
MKPSAHGSRGVVTQAKCMFCVTFGRHGQRPTTTTYKVENDFRPHKYIQHLNSQHATLWQRYQNLPSLDEKRNFFRHQSPAGLITSFMPRQSSELRFHFDPEIVDILIGRLLWRPGAIGSATHTRAMSPFTFDEALQKYVVLVHPVKQYQLTLKFIDTGMTFRMASRAGSATVDVTACTQLGSFSEENVARHVRVTCAVGFQNILTILSGESVWAFSLALDGSTCKGRQLNLHVMAVPFFESHTGLAMFDMNKLLACSSDGAANMTGHVSGVVTHLSQVAKPGFIRVWCALHQIDLVMQAAYTLLYSGAFFSTLTKMIAYLHQPSVSVRLGKACPSLSKTRWASMFNVTKFFLDHLTEILALLDDKPGGNKMTPDVQLLVVAVNALSETINESTRKLQGRQTTVNEQADEVESLAEKIMKLAWIKRIGAGGGGSDR